MLPAHHDVLPIRMFRKLHRPPRTVTIHVDDRRLSVDATDSVAAALLAANVTRFRASPINHQPRAPHCMIGACFECLVEIDGQPDRQACLTPVADGMRIRTTP